MAVYKHRGLSKGSLHFEWLSEDPDPMVSNPYPFDYEDLTFETIAGTKEDEAALADQKLTANKWLERQVLREKLASDLRTLPDVIDHLIKLTKHVLNK